MKLKSIPVGMTDWSQVPASPHHGASGTATARIRQLGEIQIRLIEYSSGYVADDWCSKGHLVFVLTGGLTIEHQDGRRYVLVPGMSYHVADDGGLPHKALSQNGATAFVVD